MYIPPPDPIQVTSHLWLNHESGNLGKVMVI